jgi:RHS repeat-associated protein
MLSEALIDNNRQFIGKEKDTETGLDYFGARYMEVGVGRFLTPDPVRIVDVATGEVNPTILSDPQRLNVYGYGLNNPYRYVDPDGKYVVAGVVITAAALLVMNSDITNAPAVGDETYSSNGAAGIVKDGVIGGAVGYVGGKIIGKFISKFASESMTRTVSRLMSQTEYDAMVSAQRVLPDSSGGKYISMRVPGQRYRGR